MSDLQCVVVTPERTELNVQVEAVILPMYDGEFGILKGHSPLIGRLGSGALKLRSASGTEKYFVSGGFVEVSKDVVSILTDRLVPVSKLNVTEAEAALAKALDLPSKPVELRAVRDKAIASAKAQLRLASK